MERDGIGWEVLHRPVWHSITHEFSFYLLVQSLSSEVLSIIVLDIQGQP